MLRGSPCGAQTLNQAVATPIDCSTHLQSQSRFGGIERPGQFWKLQRHIDECLPVLVYSKNMSIRIHFSATGTCTYHGMKVRISWLPRLNSIVRTATNLWLNTSRCHGLYVRSGHPTVFLLLFSLFLFVFPFCSFPLCPFWYHAFFLAGVRIICIITWVGCPVLFSCK